MSFQHPPSACPLCHIDRGFCFVQDWRESMHTFSLYECKECAGQFWVPFQSGGSAWYEEKQRYVRASVERPLLTRGYHKKFFDFYGKNLQGKTVFDVGCGTGEFLAEAQRWGSSPYGIDFDASAVAAAKKYFALKHVYALSIEDYVQEQTDHMQFDFITSFEAFQYSDHPIEFLKNIKKLLAPGGVFMMSVPSRERMAASLQRWDFPPNHLSRWNETSLRYIMFRAGFRWQQSMYVEELYLLKDALNSSLRLGLTGRVAQEGKRQDAARVVLFAAKIKEWLIGYIPAFVLLILGRLYGRKNGTLLVFLTS